MDLARLESTARGYPHLQGLLMLPIGAIFILAALGNLGWGPFAHAWALLAGVAVAGLAYLRIVRYYRDTYGRVRPTRSDQTRVLVVTLAGAATYLAVNLLLASASRPVCTLAAGYGLMMLGYFAVVVGVSAHQVVIFGTLVIGGLLPIWGGLGDNRDIVGLVAMGAATMLSGIFDHLQLARSLASAALPDLEGANRGA